MKHLALFFSLLVFLSCKNEHSLITDQSDQVNLKEFQDILDSNLVMGSILIYKESNNTLYSNDFEYAKKGSLPASTYKIPHSIIALETGVVRDAESMFLWDGEDRKLDIWEQDLNFRQAFHYSCVPCYQQIAREIGVERMKNQLHKLRYGHMQVSDSMLQVFWLEGESQINQYEQIDFLYRFYHQQLPISDSTYSIMKKLMVIEENQDYKLSGKTGWAIRKGQNTGWFVGYLESENDLYFFATRIEPKKAFDMSLFPIIRKSITGAAMKKLLK